MKKFQLNGAIALTLLSAGLAAMPAHAVQIAFTGGSNTGNLATVTGTDGIGDTWQTHNGDLLVNSNFAMADVNATPQTFNPDNFSNGLGSYATSFQLTLNNSQFGVGFKGILQTLPDSGLNNNFTVMPDPTDSSTWIVWNPVYNLVDATSGLFQQVLFTAPVGTQLSQGTNFSTNINFSGIMTNDSGWAASFDDRVGQNRVPEPGSLPLMAVGILGLGAFLRRRRS